MNTLEICLSWKGDSSSFFSWVGTYLPTWAVAGLSENLGKRKPSLGMLLQILVATRGNMSLVKLAGETLGIEETFMAMALVPVNVEMPGQVAVFSVSHCIL